MSSFLKILLVVVVVAGIVLAINASKKKGQEAQAPAPEPQLSSGTSDQDLNSDLSTIDTDLKAVDESSADIDAGLNDKQLQ